MKKVVTVSLAMLILFTGCSFKFPSTEAPEKPQAKDSAPPPASSKPESAVWDASTPDGAAEKLLEQISYVDENTIGEIANQYFAVENLPDTSYSLILPILKRVSYKVGNYKIDGDKAAVEIAVTSIDAQKALNSVISGALAHLAALQIAGKDVSQPEKILAEYAAKNIEWEKLPNIKTDSTLYLTRGGDGEWKADVTNPDNIGFANAISGGAVDIAQNLKSFAERF